MEVFVRLLPLVFALAACRPNLPPVAGCVPGASSCQGDRPAVCSASQRWQPVGDVSCAAVGGECVTDGVAAHCAPRRDAAADVSADAAEVSP